MSLGLSFAPLASRARSRAGNRPRSQYSRRVPGVLSHRDFLSALGMSPTGRRGLADLIRRPSLGSTDQPLGGIVREVSSFRLYDDYEKYVRFVPDRDRKGTAAFNRKVRWLSCRIAYRRHYEPRPARAPAQFRHELALLIAGSERRRIRAVCRGQEAKPNASYGGRSALDGVSDRGDDGNDAAGGRAVDRPWVLVRDSAGLVMTSAASETSPRYISRRQPGAVAGARLDAGHLLP